MTEHQLFAYTDDGQLLSGKLLSTSRGGWRVIVDENGDKHKDQYSVWGDTPVNACELAVIRFFRSRYRRGKAWIDIAKQIQIVMTVRDRILSRSILDKANGDDL